MMYTTGSTLRVHVQPAPYRSVPVGPRWEDPLQQRLEENVEELRRIEAWASGEAFHATVPTLARSTPS